MAEEKPANRAAPGEQRAPAVGDDVEAMGRAPDPAEEVAGRLVNEFDRILQTAESLQEKCDSIETRLALLNTVFIALLVTVAAAVAFLRADVRPAQLMLIGTLLLVQLPVFATLRAPMQRRLRRDRRALQGIADLLRETQSSFVGQGLASPFERAQIEIRLSRLQ